MKTNELVIILDFGSPYNQMLTRKIRELGVYSELHSHKMSAEDIKTLNPKAIILSGGPHFINDENKFRPDEGIFELGIPILGICYGMQIIVDHYGGTIEQHEEHSYQSGEVTIKKESAILANLTKQLKVFMSHGYTVKNIGDNLQINAVNKANEIVALSDEEKEVYGIQFNPENDKTAEGLSLLKNFLFNVSNCEGKWSIEQFIEAEVEAIRNEVGDKHVLCGLSGGVDSSVVAALIHKAIGDQLTCIFVDHGLLRKNEAEEVMELFADDFNMNIIKVDAQERFLSKLKGEADPETKRMIIGNEFIEVFDDEAAKLENIDYLAQGTLYSDVIESGTETGQAIKSHHNVGGLPEDMEFELIEPIRSLFKDEVRELGTALGLPDHIVWRQPFPGPGLAIRILGEVTDEKLHIVRESDAILREEIMNAYLERDIWQYFTVLPNIRSVGVRDDERSYDYTIGIRAVTSVDGMTSDWARIPWDVLDKISQRLVAEVEQINRVVYDVTSKPPSTIEWE